MSHFFRSISNSSGSDYQNRLFSLSLLEKGPYGAEWWCQEVAAVVVDTALQHMGSLPKARANRIPPANTW